MPPAPWAVPLPGSNSALPADGCPEEEGLPLSLFTAFVVVTCTSWCRGREGKSVRPRHSQTGREGQMFRILEMKQQVFPVERVRSHAQPLHPAGSSLERVRCAGSAQSFATRTRQLRVPPPVLILTACVTYFVILVGKPLGFVDLVLAPAASGAGACLWRAPQLRGSHLCGTTAVLGYSTRNWRCLVA